MSSVKIYMCQTNPTIGDIRRNCSKMIDTVAANLQQCSEQTSIHVFPELSICGYYPKDYLDEPWFERAIGEGIEQLLAYSAQVKDAYLVVGSPVKSVRVGKQWHNGLIVMHNGEIVFEYHKQLLPTYGIFDERRHFSPGEATPKFMRIGGQTVGFIICEDGWFDLSSEYTTDPVEQLVSVKNKIDYIISINASPSNVGKQAVRQKLFSNIAKRFERPIVYVNQVGGQDEIVYDGASFVMSADGSLIAQAKSFEEDVVGLSADFNGEQAQSLEQNVSEVYEQLKSQRGKEFDGDFFKNYFVYQQVVLGTKDYLKKTGFSKAIVGSSGGIDSAVVLAIAVDALGADKVHAVTMPSIYSSQGSVGDSQTLCDALSVKLDNAPIKAIVSAFESVFEQASGESLIVGVPKENLQARVRGTLLMAYSNQSGYLLLTTGNKSEVSVGYCTLYGDCNGGLGLIGDLYKTEVFELARWYNYWHGREIIPEAIIEKAPSAELAPDQKDTDSLPEYAVLDPILKYIVEGRSLDAVEYAQTKAFYAQMSSSSEGLALIRKLEGMIARNEYKRRQMPPVIRVRSRAFGMGRQMPIAAKWNPV